MNRRKLILFFLVFLASSSARCALAYNIDTHAYLTDETIIFYNRNFPVNSIPENLKDYLLDGSRREDDNIRSMNHFYDPVEFERDSSEPGLLARIVGLFKKIPI